MGHRPAGVSVHLGTVPYHDINGLFPIFQVLPRHFPLPSQTSSLFLIFVLRHMGIHIHGRAVKVISHNPLHHIGLHLCRKTATAKKASPKRFPTAVIDQIIVLNIPCLLQYAYMRPCPFFLNRTDIPCSGYSFTRSTASDVT